MTGSSVSSRSWLAPEVVQSSAMDCGPASLKCLLQGYGIQVGYDRLREACQTDVDGTSVDALEEIACDLGLEAEQVVVPLDHVLLPQSDSLPALLVVRTGRGLTHLVVVWRVHGPWVQIMDPAAGRRWLTRRRLLSEIHRHAMAVPADDWRDWAGGEEFCESLAARMSGLDRTERDRLVEEARSDPSWRGLAFLDAAVRMSDRIRHTAGIRGRHQRASLIRSLVEGCRGSLSLDDMPVPESFFAVRPEPGEAVQSSDESQQARSTAQDDRLTYVGAVLIRVRGVAHRPAEAPISGSLRRALDEPRLKPFRALWNIVRSESGVAWPVFLAISFGFAAAAMVLEVLFFRGFLDLGARLVLPEQRLSASLALIVFLACALVIEALNYSGVFRIGRQMELRFRTLILERIARLPDAYFRSRLNSDMAERSHNTHSVRELSKLAGSATKSTWQILLTAAAILWIDRALWPLVTVAVVAAYGLPILVQPMLRERDLRTRTHGGALSRFYLDALMGLIPIRSHGAQQAVRIEHEGLLVEWMRSAFRRERAKLLVDFIQACVGYGFAVWLVVEYLSQTQGLGELLLLAYWALQLQILGQQLTLVGEQIPKHYSVAVRLLEPLSEESRVEAVRQEAPSGPQGGARLDFHSLDLVVAGQRVLRNVDLEVPSGQHVAIVGRSGAGKSSLLGCLLGWNQPAPGSILVDGEVLDEVRLARLRYELVWLDPAVQIWNRSLLANLLYGNPPHALASIGSALDVAELTNLVQQLPAGLQSSLGESGSLLSGGEGQRVRMGRSWLRPNARLALLDEPFRGLDRRQRERFTGEARRRFSGATLLYVSHDIEQALGFDRVLVVHDGRIVEDGHPTDLRERDGRFRGLLETWRQSQSQLVESDRFRGMTLRSGRLTVDP